MSTQIGKLDSPDLGGRELLGYRQKQRRTTKQANNIKYQLTLIISVSTGKHLTEARMGRYSFFSPETLHNDVKKVLGFCIVLVPAL